MNYESARLSRIDQKLAEMKMLGATTPQGKKRPEHSLSRSQRKDNGQFSTFKVLRHT